MTNRYVARPCADRGDGRMWWRAWDAATQGYVPGTKFYIERRHALKQVAQLNRQVKRGGKSRRD